MDADFSLALSGYWQGLRQQSGGANFEFKVLSLTGRPFQWALATALRESGEQ